MEERKLCGDLEGFELFTEMEIIELFADVEGRKHCGNVEGFKLFDDLEMIELFADVEGLQSSFVIGRD